MFSRAGPPPDLISFHPNGCIRAPCCRAFSSTTPIRLAAARASRLHSVTTLGENYLQGFIILNDPNHVFPNMDRPPPRFAVLNLALMFMPPRALVVIYACRASAGKMRKSNHQKYGCRRTGCAPLGRPSPPNPLRGKCLASCAPQPNPPNRTRDEGSRPTCPGHQPRRPPLRNFFTKRCKSRPARVCLAPPSSLTPYVVVVSCFGAAIGRPSRFSFCALSPQLLAYLGDLNPWPFFHGLHERPAPSSYGRSEKAPPTHHACRVAYAAPQEGRRLAEALGGSAWSNPRNAALFGQARTAKQPPT